MLTGIAAARVFAQVAPETPQALARATVKQAIDACVRTIEACARTVEARIAAYVALAYFTYFTRGPPHFGALAALGVVSAIVAACVNAFVTNSIQRVRAITLEAHFVNLQ